MQGRYVSKRSCTGVANNRDLLPCVFFHTDCMSRSNTCPSPLSEPDIAADILAARRSNAASACDAVVGAAAPAAPSQTNAQEHGMKRSANTPSEPDSPADSLPASLSTAASAGDAAGSAAAAAASYTQAQEHGMRRSVSLPTAYP